MRFSGVLAVCQVDRPGGLDSTRLRPLVGWMSALVFSLARDPSQQRTHIRELWQQTRLLGLDGGLCQVRVCACALLTLRQPPAPELVRASSGSRPAKLFVRMVCFRSSP